MRTDTSVTVEVCPSCGHNIWHASLVAKAAFCAQCDREPGYRWDDDDHTKVTLACPVHGELMRIATTGRDRGAHAADARWLYERAEDAAAEGLPLDDALQAVRDGYSSIEADRDFKANP